METIKSNKLVQSTSLLQFWFLYVVFYGNKTITNENRYVICIIIV